MRFPAIFRIGALAVRLQQLMSKFCGLSCVACWIGILVLSGCGKEDSRPGRVPVTGTVLRTGQPVADASVILEPVGNTPAATGMTDAAGRFELTNFDPNDGAVPGEYKVAISKVQIIRAERPANASDDLASPSPEEKWLSICRERTR